MKKLVLGVVALSMMSAISASARVDRRAERSLLTSYLIANQFHDDGYIGINPFSHHGHLSKKERKRIEKRRREMWKRQHAMERRRHEMERRRYEWEKERRHEWEKERRHREWERRKREWERDNHCFDRDAHRWDRRGCMSDRWNTGQRRYDRDLPHGATMARMREAQERQRRYKE